jgi:hypothetical protein
MQDDISALPGSWEPSILLYYSHISFYPSLEKCDNFTGSFHPSEAGKKN